MNLLKIYRDQHNLTQMQFAKLCRLSQQMIAKIEQGGGMSVKTAKIIADVIGCDWKELFD